MEDEPHLVPSRHSGVITHDRSTVWLEIFRLEEETKWTLEVINEAGTSIVWEDRFASADAAYAVFQTILEKEGIETFLDERKVIPFPK